MNRKYIAYILLAGMSGNAVIEIIRPGLMPEDISDSSVALYRVSGTNTGSTLGISASWPVIDLASTPSLDSYGNSYYEAYVEKDY